ncbi:Helix-turn-helix domain protein [Roseimaritima multifibrata]|uniref:Helix-turn-helix domain protein n=1 Tax=Roseimaritima multifibrata TaxID=1930274 RepID=A0A517MAB3_9BACT|nr:helix-turn-helix domain-containing protein [Roseimaritima multifibrata]QDS91830.1 Helix-turn-helix domain protein [Roseimaritima multifibrata]
MRSTSAIQPQLLSEHDAAKWLGICQRTLWGLRATGEIPHVRLGRAIRYDVADLLQFVAQNKKRGVDHE